MPCTKPISCQDLAYLVVEENGVVVGGCGVAPLKGADAVRVRAPKMVYFARSARHGYGHLLLTVLGCCEIFWFRECLYETLITWKRLFVFILARLHTSKRPDGSDRTFCLQSLYVKEL